MILLMMILSVYLKVAEVVQFILIKDQKKIPIRRAGEHLRRTSISRTSITRTYRLYTHTLLHTIHTLIHSHLHFTHYKHTHLHNTHILTLYTHTPYIIVLFFLYFFLNDGVYISISLPGDIENRLWRLLRRVFMALFNRHNITTLISIRSRVNVWPRSCVNDGRVEPLVQVCQWGLGQDSVVASDSS